nr:cytochrome c biogenesis protein CcsA [Deltaproteobacteria bacterium]
MHITLLKVTTLFYLVGALLYLYFIATLKDRGAKLGRMLLLIGVILHAVGFVARYFAAGYTPVTNLFESLSFFAMAIVAVFLVTEMRYNLRVLGSFIAPLAFVFSVFSAFQSGEVARLAPALNSYWLPVHVILLFVGDAVFAIAFGAGIMYLLQEKEVKKKRMGAIFKRLPSLDVLDDINYRCLTVGFPLLTLGIITGSIWAE